MNYVRKLGFEETPDYDFLRELFTKVLKTLGEPEDGVFDWMLLNGGKGWEAGHVRDSMCYAYTSGVNSTIDIGPARFCPWWYTSHPTSSPRGPWRAATPLIT